VLSGGEVIANAVVPPPTYGAPRLPPLPEELYAEDSAGVPKPARAVWDGYGWVFRRIQVSARSPDLLG